MAKERTSESLKREYESLVAKSERFARDEKAFMRKVENDVKAIIAERKAMWARLLREKLEAFNAWKSAESNKE